MVDDGVILSCCLLGEGGMGSGRLVTATSCVVASLGGVEPQRKSAAECREISRMALNALHLRLGNSVELPASR